MNLLDHTFLTPAENLACEEVLAEQCENGGPEVLRFWESPEMFVVVGYSNRAEHEANLPACAAAGVPVLRRLSGGGTVLQGPGCLNYALILRCQPGGEFDSITAANKNIMRRNAKAISSVIGQPVQVQGHTDLTVGERKFSGNAQRRFKTCCLFHGTLLLDFDLPQIPRFLNLPGQQPAYRQNRSHDQFVMNLHVVTSKITAALQKAWNVEMPLETLSHAAVQQLARDKYETAEWNNRFLS